MTGHPIFHKLKVDKDDGTLSLAKAATFDRSGRDSGDTITINGDFFYLTQTFNNKKVGTNYVAMPQVVVFKVEDLSYQHTY